MAEFVKGAGGIIDLHTHTNHSDGDLSTQRLLERGMFYGLDAISITDHDTVAAYQVDRSLLKKAEETGLQVMTGIELSTATERDKYHVLGFNIDVDHPDLQERLAVLRETRIIYATETCHLLQEHGWHIDENKLLSDPGTITKAHIARALLAHPANAAHFKAWTGTAVPTEGQLIESTIGHGGPLYVSRSHEMTPGEASELIHNVGGVAVLAHPSFNLMKGEEITELTQNVLDWKLDGIEAIYIQYDRSDNDRVVEYRDELTKFAADYGLIVTGGSDFHTDDEQRLGKYIDLGFANYPWSVPFTVLAEIEQRSRMYCS